MSTPISVHDIRAARKSVGNVTSETGKALSDAVRESAPPALAAYLEGKDLSSPTTVKALQRMLPDLFDNPSAQSALGEHNKARTVAGEAEHLLADLQQFDGTVSPINKPNQLLSAPIQTAEGGLLNAINELESLNAPAARAAATELCNLGAQVVEQRESLWAGGPGKRPFFTAQELSSPANVAAAAKALFGSAQLASSIDAVLASPAATPELHRALGMAVRLSDQALAAPDYSRIGMGWLYPRSRAEVRRQMQSPRVERQSQQRKQVTAQKFERQLVEALRHAKPADALQRAVVEMFMSSVGLFESQYAQWNVPYESICKAIDSELLIPLRALNETRYDMPIKDKDLRYEMSCTVTGVIRHVLEGDFSDWRASLKTSQTQMVGLDEAQRKNWRAPLSIQSPAADGHSVLTTREETGPELLWVTKIGGPSHGFDYGPHCLMPLLTNLRTTPILVDDPRYQENASARAYLRLIHRSTGEPILYLEPLQRDFQHRELFENNYEDAYFYIAVLSHAVEKARELGLKLSVSPDLEGIVRYLGLRDQMAHDMSSYALFPSGGVFEASDTLTRKHDWPQTELEFTDPLPRLIIG